MQRACALCQKAITMVKLEILKDGGGHSKGDIIEVEERTAKLMCGAMQARIWRKYSNKMMNNISDKEIK